MLLAWIFRLLAPQQAFGQDGWNSRWVDCGYYSLLSPVLLLKCSVGESIAFLGIGEVYNELGFHNFFVEHQED